MTGRAARGTAGVGGIGDALSRTRHFPAALPDYVDPDRSLGWRLLSADRPKPTVRCWLSGRAAGADGGGADGGGWGSSVSDYIAVMAAAELAVGQSRCVEVDGDRILIVRSHTGFHAIEPLCSHASLELEGGPVRDGAIICPWHGARFDLRSGRQSGPPAPRGIVVYPSRVMDGQVEVMPA